MDARTFVAVQVSENQTVTFADRSSGLLQLAACQHKTWYP
jgi:hypothetical protein